MWTYKNTSISKCSLTCVYKKRIQNVISHWKDLYGSNIFFKIMYLQKMWIRFISYKHLGEVSDLNLFVRSIALMLAIVKLSDRWTTYIVHIYNILLAKQLIAFAKFVGDDFTLSLMKSETIFTQSKSNQTATKQNTIPVNSWARAVG